MTSPESYADPHAVRRYRPPIGIPESGERNRWRGLLGSIGLHLLFALIFIIPYLASEVLDVRARREGMGDGRAGGGGGGTNGTGGATVEHLYYIPITPEQRANAERRVAPPVPTPPTPPVPPPEKPPEPERPPLPVPPPPTLAPQLPQPQAATPVTASAAVALGALTLGEGGGSGHDGSAGSGPGRGGGVGSGIGSGRGSGVGPGTGAGTDSIYPPTLITLALPPLDTPRKLRPYTLVALFDVDERGRTTLIGFNETDDAGFNRKVRAVLREVRFRPAVRADGRPVRDTGRFEIEYP
ncbi:MAG TPA: hypothetical protein VFS08_02900 [Gemmatimonadaceae bacterium]|nr:hypothetical protein [Gemmatimonadaceae bacterium]